MFPIQRLYLMDSASSASISAELCSDCHFHFVILYPLSNKCKKKKKIIILICSLSPVSVHTNNFPPVIQACTPRTSVRCNWRRRGPAETSIKGCELSKVPLCVPRSGLSVALLSELPVECSLHPVHSEWLLFRSAGLRARRHTRRL